MDAPYPLWFSVCSLCVLCVTFQIYITQRTTENVTELHREVLSKSLASVLMFRTTAAGSPGSFHFFSFSGLRCMHFPFR